MATTNCTTSLTSGAFRAGFGSSLSSSSSLSYWLASPRKGMAACLPELCSIFCHCQAHTSLGELLGSYASIPDISSLFRRTNRRPRLNFSGTSGAARVAQSSSSGKCIYVDLPFYTDDRKLFYDHRADKAHLTLFITLVALYRLPPTTISASLHFNAAQKSDSWLDGEDQ